MTEQKQDRPASLTKTAPRPAPDEGVDPMDVPAPAVEKKPSRNRRVASASKTDVLEYAPKERDIVVSLSTRVSLEISRILEAEVATGRQRSVRAAVEHALLNTYAQGGRK